MKFDEVLTHIGEFGTYQTRLYFLICLPSINSGIFMVISVFLLGAPDHRYVTSQFLVLVTVSLIINEFEFVVHRLSVVGWMGGRALVIQS